MRPRAALTGGHAGSATIRIDASESGKPLGTGVPAAIAARNRHPGAGAGYVERAELTGRAIPTRRRLTVLRGAGLTTFARLVAGLESAVPGGALRGDNGTMNRQWIRTLAHAVGVAVIVRHCRAGRRPWPHSTRPSRQPDRGCRPPVGADRPCDPGLGVEPDRTHWPPGGAGKVGKR